MSKMSNTRSRTQCITLKPASLDSVPSNWVKRYNSYFYHQMLLLEVILLSTRSKIAITWSKPHNCAWDNILLDSAPLNYVKKFDPKALLNIDPDHLFFVIPTSL